MNAWYTGFWHWTGHPEDYTEEGIAITMKTLTDNYSKIKELFEKDRLHLFTYHSSYKCNFPNDFGEK